MVVGDGPAVKLVDFEACLLGTEPMYLGAVLLCQDFLDWEALRAGYAAEDGGGALTEDPRTVEAMAQYHNWHTTAAVAGGARGALGNGWVRRFQARLGRCHALLRA